MPRKKKNRKLRLALAAWEIGWADSGIGAKVGGLGTVIEELPGELVEAAARQGIDLQVEVLSPCFAHYRRGRFGLKAAGRKVPVRLDGQEFSFEVFHAPAPDRKSRLVYFWDRGQLHWTNRSSIYPEDPWMAYRLYACVSQAMAGYIAAENFDTIHAHDYHVGLIPFYLDDELLQRLPFHFTVHNASYQGNCWVGGRGYEALRSIHLPEEHFHEYFDFFGHLNLMKGVLIRTHQLGGRVTTVSGDLACSWGYAHELGRNEAELWHRAQRQKPWGAVGKVFVPNGYLDVFERIPVAGITNGLAEKNRPEKLLELYGGSLRARQRKNPRRRLFRHPEVQKEMLRRNHRFDAERLEVKARLKRLLHLEAFGSEPLGDPILLTALGRLVEQKNLGLIVGVAEQVFAHDSDAKFIVLASPQDREGLSTQRSFEALAARHPNRFFYSSAYNHPLSRLILAGGDFCLIPSRFEPCGLVDYEASLLGNVVIGHRIGGLLKVADCAYLYDWLDIEDWWGEAWALLAKVREAIDTYRTRPKQHRQLLQRAMRVDASWGPSAAQYIALYRYGIHMKRWYEARRRLIREFGRSLGKERDSFEAFLTAGVAPYADRFNWELQEGLKK